MADDTDQGSREPREPTAAERKAAAEQGKQREPRYSVQRLSGDGAILGFERHEIIAAFAEAEVDPEAELTVAQARRYVEDFLGREEQTEERDTDGEA